MKRAFMIATSLILFNMSPLQADTFKERQLYMTEKIHQHPAYSEYMRGDKDYLSEVNYLIALVRESGYTFVRDGREYSAKTAGRLLSYKYRKWKDEIDSTEYFIENCASFSDDTGTPYQVIDEQGYVYQTREILYNELSRLRDHQQKQFIRQVRLTQ